VLGHGFRANATIGRALKLCIRNLGGARPGGVERSVLGSPGKYTMCFAEHEARRLVYILEEGGSIAQETRLFDSGRGITRPMRSKEHAHDYRYFPDPDLLPLVLEPEWLARLRAELPELPDAKKARFIADYGLSAEDAGVLVAERAIGVDGPIREYYPGGLETEPYRAEICWPVFLTGAGSR